MSEFISTCPKCRQQILCDTAYVGKRIACPVCMQEIQMPEPVQHNMRVKSNRPAAGTSDLASATEKKGGNTILVAIGCAVFFLLLAVIGMLALRKPATIKATATLMSAPSQSSPAVPVENRDQCRAIWKFDQEKGTLVTDQTGNNNDGQLKGKKAVWIKSLNGDAYGLRMTGSNWVEIAGPVINTARSFTVSAWVKLEAVRPEKVQCVVSIDSREAEGFCLEYFPNHPGPGGRWAFVRAASDSKTAPGIRARAKDETALNTWYHIVGVYDADKETVSLYQDGNQQRSESFTNHWEAIGNLTIGRRGGQGRATDYFTGSIRDVRLYASVLTEEQIKDMAK